jgi:hypothetical protein
MAGLSTTPPTEPAFLPRQPPRYIVGVDLGQSIDPTAICVLEHERGVLDPGSEADRHSGLTEHLQKPAERLWVLHLQRLPLGMNYDDVVQCVAGILARPPLDESHAELVIDETGVGRAVGDIFVKGGMRPKRISITGGTEATGGHGLDRYYVAKTVLISNLDALLHTKVLRIVEKLREAGALRDELQDFQRRVSDAGRATYGARSGSHDDLVLSVAIAAWWAVRPQWTGPLFTNYGHVPRAR